MPRLQAITSTLRAALLCGVLLAPLALAQREPPIAVHFPQGAVSTTVSGTLIGEATAEYTIEVATAQSIQLKVTGSNNAYFHLYAPGEDVPLNAGGDGQRFSGLLTTPGTYRIQLYQPRDMAHRSDAVRFTLSISLR